MNCDELAWWNITLINTEDKTARRSRTGIRRSSTTPTLGMSPRGSLRLSRSSSTVSTDLINLSPRLAELQRQENPDSLSVDEQAQNSWSTKEPKDYLNQTALLGLVPLPPSCKAKVCISSDFNKFLLVDVHGSINVFKLLN